MSLIDLGIVYLKVYLFTVAVGLKEQEANTSFYETMNFNSYFAICAEISNLLFLE